MITPGAYHELWSPAILKSAPFVNFSVPPTNGLILHGDARRDRQAASDETWTDHPIMSDYGSTYPYSVMSALSRRRFLKLAGAAAAAPSSLLEARDAGVVVNDIHAQINPTRVRGREIPNGSEVALHDGDNIELGNLRLGEHVVLTFSSPREERRAPNETMIIDDGVPAPTIHQPSPGHWTGPVVSE